MRFSDLTRLGDGPVATVYSGHHDGAPDSDRGYESHPEPLRGATCRK